MFVAAHDMFLSADLAGNKEKKNVRSTIELKKEIIAKIEQGKRVTDVAKEYGMARTTVSSILKNKETIKAADVAKGVTSICRKQRPQILDEMEKLLLMWIEEKKMAGDSVSEAIICKKAKQIHSDLQRGMLVTSIQSDDFKASRGWFENFKKRSGMHIVVRHEEADSSKKKIAEVFANEFEDLVNSEGYLPQQVFNCDETGLFLGKKKDRVSDLLSRNASVTLDPTLVAGDQGSNRDDKEGMLAKKPNSFQIRDNFFKVVPAPASVSPPRTPSSSSPTQPSRSFSPKFYISSVHNVCVNSNYGG